MTWRTKQHKDKFFRQSKIDGYRSRAAYKLIQIQDQFNIIKHKDDVLDLGCAPGGWLQVIKKYTTGFIAGIDLQPIQTIHGVHIGQFDFTDTEKVREFLKISNAPEKFSVIVSDMSPQISGDKTSDHFMSMDLVGSVFQFSLERLKSGGYMLCKLFDGADTQTMLNQIKQKMSVRIIKPDASRSESSEIYILCSYCNETKTRY